MEDWKKKSRDQIHRRTEQLRRRIAAMDLTAPGTLHIRTKTCGRPNCRCAKDPAARHGPYYEWSRREGRRLVHNSISADQAELLALALDNNREIRKLLTQWERETVRIILNRPEEPEG